MKPFSKSGFTERLDAVIIFLNATAVKLIYKQIKNFNFKSNTFLVLKHSGQFKPIKISSKQKTN